MSDIQQKVKAQFAKTSESYVSSPIHAKGEDLKMLLELAGDVKDKDVLDIATGAGHTALAFAKAGARVTATDLTPEMLEQARVFLKSQNIHQVSFQEASAEELPFEDESFNAVTCRIAAHHFVDIGAFVQEVARVLKPTGQFLLVDNISPLDKELAQVMNHIEKTRDPSHVWAYSIPTWMDHLTKVNLEVYSLQRFKRKKNFVSWTQNAQTPQKVITELEEYILSLSEGLQDYFEIIEDRKLLFLSHEVMVLQAIKKTTHFGPS